MRVTVLAMLAACLLLAACGGGQAGEGSKEQFIVAADKICSRFPRPLVRSDRAGGDGGGTFASRVSTFADRVQRGVAGLERLELPLRGDRATAEAFIDSMKGVGRSVAQLKAATDDLAGSDPTDADRVGGLIARVGVASAELDRLVRASNGVARDYGFSNCDRVL